MTTEVKRLIVVAIASLLVSSTGTALFYTYRNSTDRYQAVSASTTIIPAIYVLDKQTGDVVLYANQKSNFIKKPKSDIPVFSEIPKGLYDWIKANEKAVDSDQIIDGILKSQKPEIIKISSLINRYLDEGYSSEQIVDGLKLSFKTSVQ